MSRFERHNVKITGRGERTMMFAHGFGCDQSMWRLVAPAFENCFRVVCFDYIGAGNSDLSVYDEQKYSRLHGYAEDVVALAHELEIQDGVFVGHSVSAMIGVLAAKHHPELFSDLVLVAPSPRYIDDGKYVGGSSAAQIHDLLDFLDRDHFAWSRALAPVIIGNLDRPEHAGELTNSFCKTNPKIARQFARTTFLSDNRADLDGVMTRSLILQCAEDIIAPQMVGEYVHQKLHNSQLVLMKAKGHCPNLTAPDETIRAIKAFV